MGTQPSTDSIAALLFVMRSKGVSIWADNGRLRYQSPRGVLTPQEFEKLRALRTEIAAFLQRSPAAIEPPLAPHPHSDPVPLAFSQQWLWNGLELEKRHSMRTVAAAVRLSGQLNIGSLRQSLTELVRRHESLRTRIAMVSGIPTQEVLEDPEYRLDTIELSGISKCERPAELERLTKQFLHEPFFVTDGPLFAAKLLKLGDCHHVLVIAMDHIISDRASVGILLRELSMLYAYSAHGLACLLPKIPVQFPDYAVWQQKTHQSWAERHGAYWRERLSGGRRIRLFADDGMPTSTVAKWATLPIWFGAILSTELRAISRRERTTLVMSVLTVYVALVFRWCNTVDLVVPFITMGRLRHELDNVVGCFGGPVFLRIALLESDTFLDLLQRVTAEYGTAHGHHDSCKLTAQIPTPEFARNPTFNWIPQEFDVSHAVHSHNSELHDAVRIEQYKFEITLRDDMEWGIEVELELSDTKDGVTGAIVYRADRFAARTVEQFGRNLRLFAEKLVTEPSTRVVTLSCEQ